MTMNRHFRIEGGILKLGSVDPVSRTSKPKTNPVSRSSVTRAMPRSYKRLVATLARHHTSIPTSYATAPPQIVASFSWGDDD